MLLTYIFTVLSVRYRTSHGNFQVLYQEIHPGITLVVGFVVVFSPYLLINEHVKDIFSIYV